MNPFVENVLPEDWMHEIYMKNVFLEPEMRILTEPLPCGDGEIQPGFKWDGSSVPKLLRGIFPKHRHPIASCRHDFRCARARNAEERKFADREFRKDVRRTDSSLISTFGYVGVRIGAWLGIGSNF